MILQKIINMKSLFLDYLKTGGFPLPIQDYFSTKSIRSSTKRTYLDWIRGDLLKFKKNQGFMKEILQVLLASRASPISWLSISKNTSINSPHTVNSYLETLENLYLIIIFYMISPEKRIQYRKRVILFFTAKFMKQLKCGIIGRKFDNKPKSKILYNV